MIFNFLALSALLGIGLANDTTTSSLIFPPFTDCGGSLVGDSGNVESPDYPRNYPNRARCVWTITTDPGTRVRLSFNSFHLETSPNCSYDSLVVRDGSDSSASIITNLCGYRTPDEITSTGNAIYLEFTSDRSVNNRGFNINWSAENASEPLSIPDFPHHQNFTGTMPSYTIDCGGDLIGEAGTIQSPNYPNRYPYNARCVWTITTDPGTRIRLSFSSFAVENGPGCSYDSLKVRDGSDSSASIIMNLCGYRTRDEITSTGNAIYLEFTSDRSVNDRGFNINWSAEQVSGEQN